MLTGQELKKLRNKQIVIQNILYIFFFDFNYFMSDKTKFSQRI
ncbi:hypothetical protein SBF1_300012 [Candidatus Desulfosporosinus infrequens]|uniref:Uncharacterized protein n=1 Tax=Candidatus Desulfosporosinus infrequens TaxID=2043169 RepID=A0A2U3KWF1_9FIRM|nr:hypothetical protein SBF1_300012 [Candidatus Desulfosporosinus infrequens]